MTRPVFILVRLNRNLDLPEMAPSWNSFAADSDAEEPGSTAFWYKLLISCALVLIGGVFAGLTLGLMGLDELHLRVLAMSSDDEKERVNATKGQPSNHQLLRLHLLTFLPSSEAAQKRSSLGASCE